MLACVCQPADTGIFRRSQIPLGASPLKLNSGAIPKPGRILGVSPIITSEPSTRNSHSSVEKNDHKLVDDTPSSSEKLPRKKSKHVGDIISRGTREGDAVNAQNLSNSRPTENRRQQNDKSLKKSNRLDQVRMAG